MTTATRRADGLVIDDSGVARCFWAGTDPLYREYHDDEWGRATHDEARLFEKICLEGFQSGLSWLTILKKRENFRRAFHGFEIERVARITSRGVDKLLRDPGIVRHRGKIESTINNARQAKKIITEFGSLDAYFWSFVPPRSERPKKLTRAALLKMGRTPTSVALSKDLKNRGFSFVGPTTCYAFMQAMGLVNDHIEGCNSRMGSGPLTTK